MKNPEQPSQLEQSPEETEATKKLKERIKRDTLKQQKKGTVSAEQPIQPKKETKSVEIKSEKTSKTVDENLSSKKVIKELANQKEELIKDKSLKELEQYLETDPRVEKVKEFLNKTRSKAEFILNELESGKEIDELNIELLKKYLDKKDLEKIEKEGLNLKRIEYLKKQCKAILEIVQERFNVLKNTDLNNEKELTGLGRKILKKEIKDKINEIDTETRGENNPVSNVEDVAKNNQERQSEKDKQEAERLSKELKEKDFENPLEGKEQQNKNIIAGSKNLEDWVKSKEGIFEFKENITKKQQFEAEIEKLEEELAKIDTGFSLRGFGNVAKAAGGLVWKVVTLGRGKAETWENLDKGGEIRERINELEEKIEGLKNKSAEKSQFIEKIKKEQLLEVLNIIGISKDASPEEIDEKIDSYYNDPSKAKSSEYYKVGLVFNELRYPNGKGGGFNPEKERIHLIEEILSSNK